MINQRTVYSNSETTFKDTYGSVVFETTYYISTPISFSSITYFKAWTGSFTSTYSIYVTTTTIITDSDGNKVEETIYYVLVPESISTSHTTFTYFKFDDIEDAISYSTYILTGSDEGNEIIGTIYYVQTPSRYATSTFYLLDAIGVPITVATNFSSISGEDGNRTTKSIYVVNTPLFISSAPPNSIEPTDASVNSSDNQENLNAVTKQTIHYSTDSDDNNIIHTNSKIFLGNETAVELGSEMHCQLDSDITVSLVSMG